MSLPRESLLFAACGERFSSLSENFRLQLLPLTPPRGHIRDRNGKILDTVVTYKNGNANFQTYFLNQGNVTLEVRAFFEIENKNQSLTINSPFTLVKPNQVAKLSSSLPLKTGTYNLTTLVYWLAGNTSKFQTIEIKEAKKEIVFIPKIDYLPLIILVIIIIISYLIWKYV